MDRVLLDTNFLVYAIDDNSLFQKQCLAFLERVDIELFTSSKNISEFLSVVTKGDPSPLSIDQAMEVITEIISMVTVIFPNQFSYSIFRDLLYKYRPKGLKIHDTEIVSISLAHNVPYIATFNRKDFEKITEIYLVSL